MVWLNWFAYGLQRSQVDEVSAYLSYSNKLFRWLLECSRAYLYHYFSLFCLTKRRLASAEREHCLGSRDQLASEETPAEGIIPFFSSPPQLLD